MKNDTLQPSENLANHFAPYREEAPLISLPEVEKLLTGSATLKNHPPTPSFFRRGSFFNNRRILMTLSGIAGLATFSYFAFFSNHFNGTIGTTATNGPNTTQRSYLTQPSHDLATDTRSQLATPASTTAKHTSQLLKTGNVHGPWSAGNDQFYADLSPEELAKLGIVVNADTVIAYKLPPNKPLESMQLTAHSIGGGNAKATLPAGVNPPSFFPVLMTRNNGHGAAFVIEEKGRTQEWGMVSDDEGQKMVRDWLQSPGTPGYSPIWFKTSSFKISDTSVEINKWTLEVGKNFAKPPMPFCVPNIDGLSESTKAALMQLANYYSGKAEKPDFTMPKNLFLNVDTVTPQNMLDEIDSEENDATMTHLRSTMARLNELVPVIVRPKGGSGAPDTNDFIFWYEPSEALFNALPPAQAVIFREKLNTPPHCMTSPNAVLTSAEVTFCVDHPQTVHITVRDLTGKDRISWDKAAITGDNVDTFSTATLASGMYLVTVKDDDGNERTRRMWIENTHPKEPGWEYENMKPDAEHAMETFSTFGGDTTDNIQKAILNITCIVMDNEKLASIGIENNDSLAAFYHSTTKAGTVDYVGVLRNSKVKSLSKDPIIDGVKPKFLQLNDITSVTVPTFHPLFVTDGRGVKRLFMTDFSNIPTFDAAENLRKIHEMNKKFDEADQLIPILLRADNSSDSVGSRDLIFWYKPTPEFLAALPDSERAVAQMMSSGTNNPPASATDVHGAIQEAIAYPNPSHGKFNVNVTLNAKRTITITLRNLLGQEAAPPVQTYQMGMSATPNSVTYTYSPWPTLDFSSVPEGVYLLDISSDQGERYIERVVIAH